MRENSGLGLGIGAMIVVFFVVLPFVLPVALYVFLTVYAIVKGSAFHASTIDVGAVLAGVAVLVAALLLLLLGAIALIGRTLGSGSFRRLRRRDDL